MTFLIQDPLAKYVFRSHFLNMTHSFKITESNGKKVYFWNQITRFSLDVAFLGSSICMDLSLEVVTNKEPSHFHDTPWIASLCALIALRKEKRK